MGSRSTTTFSTPMPTLISLKRSWRLLQPKPMGRVFRSGWRLSSLLLLLPVLMGAADPQEVERAAAATGALVEILNLWHVEDYGAIYDRGTTTTRGLFTRGEFISRMKALGCRTPCCPTTFELTP